MILLAFNHSCPLHAPFLRFYLHLRTVCAVLRQQKENFCLPKVLFLFIQAAGLVYHHDAVVDIISPFGAVSHHAPACIPLQLDDIQHYVLVIYNSSGIDDIQGCALIYIQKCGTINSSTNVNLTKGGPFVCQ